MPVIPDLLEDFEGFSTGVQPAGWTKYWADRTVTVEDASGDQYLAFASSGGNIWSLIAPDDLPAASHFDLTFDLRYGTGVAAVRTYAAFCAATAQIDGYVIALRHNSGATTGNELTFFRIDNGSQTALQSASFTSNPDTWYRMRVRREPDGRVRAMVWPASSSPPALWMIDHTDNTYASGRIGFGLRQSGITGRVDNVAANIARRFSGTAKVGDVVAQAVRFTGEDLINVYEATPDAGSGSYEIDVVNDVYHALPIWPYNPGNPEANIRSRAHGPGQGAVNE